MSIKPHICEKLMNTLKTPEKVLTLFVLDEEKAHAQVRPCGSEGQSH